MKHDENKDLKSISKIAAINPGDKTIKCLKNCIIGIRRWGKIDFLTKHCGWHLIWDNSVKPSKSEDNDSSNVKKKPKKTHDLTDKTKKSSKKK